MKMNQGYNNRYDPNVWANLQPFIYFELIPKKTIRRKSKANLKRLMDKKLKT
jgi:hypothetical protein